MSSRNKTIVYEIPLNFISLSIYIPLYISHHDSECKNTQIFCIPLCKSSHSSCDAGGKASVTYCQLLYPTKQLFSHIDSHLYKKFESIYTWVNLYLQCLNYIKCKWFICQNSASENDLWLALLVFFTFMYVYLHLLQVEYHDPVMKCCMRSKICGIHTMQHYTNNNHNNKTSSQ